MTAKWAPSRAAASSCLPSLRRAELGPGRDARPPRSSVAIRRRATVSSGSAPDHDRDRRRLRAAPRTPVSLEREDQPVEPDPEPDPGRRPAAEQLDQAVVAAAAAERLLLALAAGDVELERGPRVVVEAADEPRLEPVRHAERVEVRADRREVLGARRRTAGR